MDSNCASNHLSSFALRPQSAPIRARYIFPEEENVRQKAIIQSNRDGNVLLVRTTTRGGDTTVTRTQVSDIEASRILREGL